jgi:hypothetical protein
MATIKCIQDTHFATLVRFDYEGSLMKIERKRLNKMIEFMKQIPCFRTWTRNTVSKFSYFLKKVTFKRNQYVYKEGDKIDRIYIIKKGEFEISRRLVKETMNKEVEDVASMFGYKAPIKNVLH